MELEVLLPPVVDGHPREVAGHQVGGELHARKLQSEAVGQRMRQRGLAHAGDVLDQQVTAGQQAGHAVLDLGGFAHNHRVKLIQKRLDVVLCLHGTTLAEKTTVET
ncbi:hypothetical protein D3C78_1260420 [compost metagenome]